MGDYTNMSGYYDAIMTSGYYDYEGIVDSLLSHGPFESVLEIGCGTGLILEEIAKRQGAPAMAGMDLTEAMLAIARKRLERFPNVSLSLQNVIHFEMEKQYELAFSYGGVWYFVIDGDKEPFMVSHLPEDADNHQGIEHLAKHVRQGGKLLLGVQGPHIDYERVISNGMKYSQKIAPGDNGFTKHYYLADDSRTVMAQTLQYRTYSFSETRTMLSAHGFEYEMEATSKKRFLAFKKI
ncbi:MAG: class I SAM-dependent methyltransferase [Betaproteobacteria bacterium]|nr:class I SAM-dependent methyltransferase [Betaproteobacteria bacterium]